MHSHACLLSYLVFTCFERYMTRFHSFIHPIRENDVPKLILELTKKVSLYTCHDINLESY